MAAHIHLLINFNSIYITQLIFIHGRMLESFFVLRISIVCLYNLEPLVGYRFSNVA